MRADETMPAIAAAGERPAAGERAPADPIRARLVPPLPGSAAWGWIGPLLVTALGGFLRFYRLGVPHAVVFDETYYVPDGYSILRHGVEWNHSKHVDALLARGSTHIFTGPGEYVAHP